MHKLTTEVRLGYEYEIEDFGKAVLVVSKVHSGKAPSLPTDIVVPTSTTTIDVLRGSFFRKRAKSYGKAWLTKGHAIPRTELLTVVKKDYLQWYKTKSGLSYEREDPYVKDPRRVLRKGNWEQVVGDWTWYNGLMYGLNGKAIPRLIHFDDIAGLCSTEYNLTQCRKVLQKNPKVLNIELVNVPYYNGGGTALTFDYQPTAREFAKLTELEDRHEKGYPKGYISFAAKYKIISSLKVGKFKKPERECEYGY